MRNEEASLAKLSRPARCFPDVDQIGLTGPLEVLSRIPNASHRYPAWRTTTSYGDNRPNIESVFLGGLNERVKTATIAADNSTVPKLRFEHVLVVFERSRLAVVVTNANFER